MSYLDLLQNRYACKKFDESKTISAEDETTILEAARLSPSSFGLEPWKLVVIHNKDLREKLLPACWNQPQITTSNFLVVILSRASHNFRGPTDYIKDKVAAKGFPQEMQEGYINMLSQFIMGVETNEWAKRQCYIALSNMINAATSLGINSCPLEGFEPENVTKILKQEKNLNLDDFNVCVLCAFGYSAMDKPQQQVRSDQADIIEKII
ncbi:NAD(P)H-dependent oxidoreductase [Thiotrichales bacterium 19S3-7]|nr:NAD(P)H-dependent oxidoreductase [Thiotrichales bacterium 19S3-7]MCF6802991.1 NAD(P)H-dependent oxidoreductase [Thiotrichales bacterium 19S3-11]